MVMIIMQDRLEVLWIVLEDLRLPTAWYPVQILFTRPQAGQILAS